jgi:hypothetical protein
MSKLNKSQKSLLNDFLGEEGDCFEEMRQSRMKSGAKILYLERAITLERDRFEVYLAKLYQPNTTPEAEKTSLLLIRDLKRINDLFFNYPVKYYQMNTRPALEDTFGSLGAIDVAVFQDEIKVRIETYQAKLASGQTTAKVKEEKQARERLEVDIQPKTEWKAALARLLDDSETPEARIRRCDLRQLEYIGYLVASGQATHSELDRLSNEDFLAIFANAAEVGSIERAGTEDRPASVSPDRPAPRWSLYGFFAGAARHVGLQLDRAENATYGM